MRITNLAIIDRVEVEFGEGFNVLTGETGAGKSIVIGALNLLLGAKVSQDLIRTGEQEARVEALFQIDDANALPEPLREHVDEDGQILLARTVVRTGRSKAAINGGLATASMVQGVARGLVSIFGQHEQHLLLDPDEHLEMLDRFAGLGEHVHRVADAHTAWKQTVRKLRETEDEHRNMERRREEDAAAAAELGKAELSAAEEDELHVERDVLKNAVQIRAKAYDAYQELYGRTGSLLERAADIRKAVDYLVSANSQWAPIQENVQEAVFRLEDVARELHDVAQTTRADPARLDRIEDRIALIRKLKRKYGKDVPGLLDYLQSLNRHEDDLLAIKALMKKHAQEVEDALKRYVECARELSAARREAAGTLEQSVSAELKDLAMPHASFHVSFQQVDEQHASPRGLDRIEFLLTANPGEDPKPLARIASGGELSRIMLSLEALQISGSAGSTVIFDEVDSGIGGHTATSVGTRLAQVARSRQVLCITHLHQVAALAAHHFSVQKIVEKGRTRIRLVPLDRPDRIEELARMLGASVRSEGVKEHVERLLDLQSAEVSG